MLDTGAAKFTSLNLVRIEMTMVSLDLFSERIHASVPGFEQTAKIRVIIA
jgi:hypothetical protein